MGEAAGQPGGGPKGIRQGNVYWAVLPESSAAHPCVIVQEDVINNSRVQSVVVCALTTNLKRASLPGNVLLEAGEANLPRASVVEVSKVSVIEKDQLGDYIGALAEQRVHEIIAGMQFVQRLAGSGRL